MIKRYPRKIYILILIFVIGLYLGIKSGEEVGVKLGIEKGRNRGFRTGMALVDSSRIIKGPITLCNEDISGGTIIVIVEPPPVLSVPHGAKHIAISDFYVDYSKW